MTDKPKQERVRLPPLDVVGPINDYLKREAERLGESVSTVRRNIYREKLESVKAQEK